MEKVKRFLKKYQKIRKTKPLGTTRFVTKSVFVEHADETRYKVEIWTPPILGDVDVSTSIRSHQVDCYIHDVF